MDTFLDIKEIPGDSTDAAHPDAMVINAFEFSETNKATQARGGGRGSGKVEMSDVKIEKPVCKASSLLALACAIGQHLPEATITVRRAGGAQEEYMTILLKENLITSYSISSVGGNEVPVETFTINFDQIEWTYTPQKADGTLDAPVKAGYDLAAAQKL